MNCKLLAVSTVPAINIGDYIQALAASQFYPQVNGFIEREKLKDYTGEPSKVIMNAYYMHDGNQWPPSRNIIPLFVSMHINSLVRKSFSTSESINYLKQFEPIGCRDYDTQRFLESNNVKAYFSGCMTLTLGRKYKNNKERKGLFFVDPKVTFRNKAEKIFYFALSYLYNKSISVIGFKYWKHTCLSANERAFVAKFYIKYKKLFSKESLLSAQYETHESSFFNLTFKTNKDCLGEAERLIIEYSNAALVVTSRIHCALPCLGMHTPVLYINNQEQSESSYCRLDGLRDLFNVLEWNHAGITPKFRLEGKLSETNHPLNKDSWKPLAESLVTKCQSFF